MSQKATGLKPGNEERLRVIFREDVARTVRDYPDTAVIEGRSPLPLIVLSHKLEAGTAETQRLEDSFIRAVSLYAAVQNLGPDQVAEYIISRHHLQALRPSS